MTEIYICDKCGSMDWDESIAKTISTHYWIDEETLKLKEEDNNSELLNQDPIIRCSECENEEMLNFDLDKKQLREIIKMTEKKRLEWLKKYLVIQGIK